MNGTVAVLHETEVLEEAYDMGFEAFDTDIHDAPEPMEALSHFKESAQYANNTAPSLRALAGFVDDGPGTYRVERPAVVVPPENADDLPASGWRHDPDWVLNAVQEAFDAGALDAMTEGENGESLEGITIR